MIKRLAAAAAAIFAAMTLAPVAASAATARPVPRSVTVTTHGTCEETRVLVGIPGHRGVRPLYTLVCTVSARMLGQGTSVLRIDSFRPQEASFCTWESAPQSRGAAGCYAKTDMTRIPLTIVSTFHSGAQWPTHGAAVLISSYAAIPRVTMDWTVTTRVP